MATSGSSSFSLNLEEIVEEAYDRCGLRSATGYDYKTARRSLDLLFVEWQNRGTNFWTLEQATLSLVASTITYSLPATTFDLLEGYLRTGSGTTQVDYPLTRISVSEYATIPNKNTEARPVNYWLEKKRDNPEIRFWPAPDTAYTFVYHALTRIEDTGTPASNDADLPYRFLPAVVAGLAFKLAEKKAPDRKADLQIAYEQAWADAVAGDRERASWRLRPGLGSYSRR